MICPSCGYEITEKAKFCENCGAPVAELWEQAEQQTEVEQPQEAVFESVPQGGAAAAQEPPAPQGAPLGGGQQHPASHETSSQVEGAPVPPQGAPLGGNGQPAAPQGAPIGASGGPVPPQGAQAGAAGGPVPPQGASIGGAPVPPQGRPVNPSASSKSSGKAIAALVCGILSILCSGTVIVGIVLGIVAIVLASSACKNGPDGKAKAGRITGIIGLVLSVLLAILVVFVGFNSGSMKSFSNKYAPSSGTSSSSSKSTTADITYKNSRFGYSIKIPDSFTKKSETTDGVAYQNSTLNMRVELIGLNNTSGITPASYAQVIAEGNETAQIDLTENTVLVYQIEKKNTCIYAAYVGKGSINELRVSFTHSSDESKELAVVSSLLSGFASGDIGTTH